MDQAKARDFTCIYCLRPSPSVAPSKAHIFPYVLGGSVSSSHTVCDECNNRVNQDVESPALPLFAFFNSYFNVRGHHGIRPVPARVTIDEHEVTTHLNNRGLPVRPLVRKVADSRGDGFLLFGYSLEDLQAEQRKLAEKRSDLKWEPVQEDTVSGTIALPEPTAVELRRLAAKVAFEHFADTHGATVTLDSDFDEVRRFILTGDQRQLRSVVVEDRRLTHRSLVFPVPSHAACLPRREHWRFDCSFVGPCGIEKDDFLRQLQYIPDSRRRSSCRFRRRSCGARRGD